MDIYSDREKRFDRLTRLKTLVNFGWCR